MHPLQRGSPHQTEGLLKSYESVNQRRQVLKRIIAGAAAVLRRPGGWLGVVTEVPNAGAADRWLAPLLSGGGWRLAVAYADGDVVRAY